MIADFDEVFNDTKTIIPKEILNLIEQDLPSNFCCYKDSEKGIIVGPKKNQKITLKVDMIFDDELRSILKDIPDDRRFEYLYRIQKRVPVKNAKIGDEEKQIPLGANMQNPLSDPVELGEGYMYPEPFPDAIPINIEFAEGDEIILKIKRQPYASLDEIMFANENFTAIKIKIIMNEKNINQSKITYSVTPTKAKNVSEAVIALRLLKGFCAGTVKINGYVPAFPKENMVDENYMTDVLDLWITLEKLEKILNVTFDPAAGLTDEDIRLLAELNTSFLENKRLKWDHPFDHVHVAELDIKVDSVENILGKEKMSMCFLEGPIYAKLLGAEFKLYSETEMNGFIITNIEWDDETKTSGEMYIADEVNGESWTLTRKYLTEKDMETREVEQV